MARSLERDCLELLVATLESLREFSAVLVDKRDTYSESERFLGDVSEQLLVVSQQVEKIEDLVSQRVERAEDLLIREKENGVGTL